MPRQDKSLANAKKVTADGGLFASTDTPTRMTLCRKTNRSTRCAYLYRESSLRFVVESALGCDGRCDGGGNGRGNAGVELLLMCFFREQALAASPLYLQPRARPLVLRFWTRCLLSVHGDEEAQTHCHSAF
jgi:hypothetical protein